MKTPNRLFCIVVILFSFFAHTIAKAGGNGEIKVVILDADGAPALGAVVSLLNADQVIERKSANDGGNVTFKEVLPGKYDLKVEMITMVTHIQKNVEATANSTTYVNIKLKENLKILDSVEILPYVPPIITTCIGCGITIPADVIVNYAGPTGDIVGIITALNSDLQPTADGKDFYSRGARSGSNEYMVDGEKVIGSFGVPSLSIWSMTVYTGGVPAVYGDFTGGLVLITTKNFFNGIQQKRIMYEEISKHRKEKEGE